MIKYRGLIRLATGINEEPLAVPHAADPVPRGPKAPPVPAPSCTTITLSQLLEQLAQRHGPEFAYYTRGVDGTLLPHAMVVVDGKSVRRGQDVELVLAEGAVTEIMVVPAMCGG